MNEDIDTNQQRPTVTSAGNSWVICHSKSRPGHIYYFNTLSGQAVWNLSPDEIEKAKKYTKGLPISEIEKCPEPSMDPPMHPIMNSTSAAESQNYNERFIRPIPNSFPNVFPMGVLNVNNMPGVPNIHALNPLLWSNTPSNPSAPVIYVAYPSQMNFQQQQEYPQNVSTHINEETNNYRKTYIHREDDVFNRSNIMPDKRDQSRFESNMQQTSVWTGNKPDLRQKLTRKRSITYNSGPYCDRGGEVGSYQDVHTENKNFKHQKMETLENISKYDLSVLEQLKAPYSTASRWFIVVDTNIILRHFPFLSKITDPDQDCYLMVPDHVMKELEQLVLTEGDVQIRRILRFLSQQIEADLVIKGDEMPRNAGINDNETKKMLNACEDLAEENNVILLSNDIKYQRYKNDYSSIHILNLNEIKQIFDNVLCKQMSNKRNKSPTLDIKIVVPNDNKIFQTRPMSPTPHVEARSLTPKKKELGQTLPIPICLKSTANNVKKILDDNAPTQFFGFYSGGEDTTLMKTQESVESAETPSLTNGEERRKIKLFRSCNNKGNAEGTQSRQYRWRKRINSCAKVQSKCSSVSSDQATSTKLCHQTTNSTKANDQATSSNLSDQAAINKLIAQATASTKPSDQATSYKLGYQTNSIKPNDQAANSNPGDQANINKPSDQATNSKPIQQQEAASVGSLMPSCLNLMSPKPITEMRAPSLDRSSISSHKGIRRPNIIIEETSMSGVISNSTIGSDSANNTHVKLMKTITTCDDGIFEMFEVVGQSMEEVLRTRREEWVLRFIQIMEETLKEILRVDSPFQSKCNDYTLRWAADLPELAKCIIKKFSDHFNVVDAANRLSFKLRKISNSQGANIEPKHYMEMYSYGVYLIKSLQNVAEACEDLSTADESLKKLLYDIQNPNLDTCHNDTFVDELNESAKPPHPENALPHEFPNCEEVNDGQDRINSSNKGSKLSPRGSNTQINKQSQSDSANMDTIFFSSLALVKNTNSVKPSLNLQNKHITSDTSVIAQTPPLVSPLPKSPLNSPCILKANTAQDVSAANDNGASNSTNANFKNTDNEQMEISFVRNFRSIPKFEDIVNKRRRRVVSYDPIEEEYEINNFDYNYGSYGDEYYEDNEKNYELEDGEIVDNESKILLETKEVEVDNLACQQAKNERFKCFNKKLTDEIRRVVKSVNMLCTKFIREMRSSHTKPSQDIQHELRTACTSITSINSAIDKTKHILSSATPEHDIIKPLRDANLDNFVPSKELLVEYRNVIEKCSIETNACCDRIALIMQEAGMQKLP